MNEAPVEPRIAAGETRFRRRLAEVMRSGVPVWLLAVAVALPLFVLLIDLGTPSLWDPDEGLPAEIAREMLVTRRWLVPQLNFEPYPEKSPAYFWVIAGAMSLFGMKNEAAIRLPSVLLALSGCWMTLRWGWRHVRPIAGTFAAIVLSTAAGTVAIGRLGIDDAASGFVLAIALLAMSEPLLDHRARFPWLFWLPLGIAVHWLGPSALLAPILVAFGFVALVREPARLLDLRPFRGLGILVATVLPVFALATLRDSAYAGSFFGNYNEIRFLDPHFDSYHSYSLVSLVTIVVVLFLPWTGFLPWVLRDALRTGGERSPFARPYLTVWLVADVAFFLLTNVNPVTYVVIALFPLAILTGRALARFLRRPRSISIFSDPVLAASSMLFLAVLFAPFATRRWLQNEFPAYADKLVFSYLLIPLAAAGLGAVARRNRLGALGTVAACGALTLVGLYRYGSESVSAYNSMEVPANLIAARLPGDATLVSYGTTSHTLAFYSGRPVAPLGDVTKADALLHGDAPAAILTKERFLPDVRARIDQPLYVWWVGDSKKMLLATIPPPEEADRRILLPLSRLTRSNEAGSRP
jgi:4-amino-4-deoxy-L-arabinose transferase-like glycosyltransferase